MELFVAILTACLNILLGLFALVKNRKNSSNRLLFVLTLSIASWAIANYFSLTNLDDPETTLLFVNLVMLLTAPLGPSILFLVITLPKGELPRKNPFVIFFSITAVLTALIAMSPLMFSKVEITNGAIQPSPGPGILLYAVNTLGSIVAAFYLIIKKYKHSFGIEKTQLKYIITGVIATFSLMLMTNFIFVIVFKVSSFVIFGPLFSVILISFFTYAIVKHRFLDIGLVVARSVSYTLLLLTLGFIYAGGLFVVGTFITRETTTSSNLITSSLLALVMAFSFQPLRRFLERITDSIFYQGHYDTQELLSELTRVMASTFELKDLTQKILTTLLRHVRIARGSIILIDQKKTTFIQTRGYTNNHIPEIYFKEIKRLLGKHHSRGLLIFDELKPGQTKNLLRERGIAITVPLITKSGPLGIIALSEKSSGDIYSDQDLNLFKILAPELAIAIQNAQAFDEIKRFNITLREEIKKATADLRRANDRLRQLDKLKDEFLSIASHELRTPMAAIKSYLWMVLNKERQEDHLSGKTQTYLDRAYQSTERLIALVNDMLDVSRIEGGRVELNPVNFQLCELADEVKEEVKPKADEKQLQFTIEPCDLPDTIADKDKTHQVFLNLLGNAIKFTPQGGKITISFKQIDFMIETSISDTGEGIPSEDLPKLFTKFGRLEGSLTAMAKHKGTGLGLYICKQYIEMMKGQISVKSEVGKGTTFTFTLPLASK